MLRARLDCAIAAGAVVALLAASHALAGDGAGVRASMGLPSTALDGEAGARRNVRVAAEGDLYAAELTMASCLPAASASPTPAARSGAACGSSPDADTGADLGHQFAFTFKLPQWQDGAPLVDFTLRRWNAAPRVADAGTRRDGTAGEVALTQVIASVDVFAGLSAPLAASGAAGRWRSAFAGVTWYAAPRTRVEFVVDRGVESATGTLDRTLTLRLSHAVGRSTRWAAWATRAPDDRSAAWRAGAGLEVVF